MQAARINALTAAERFLDSNRWVIASTGARDLFTRRFQRTEDGCDAVAIHRDSMLTRRSRRLLWFMTKFSGPSSGVFWIWCFLLVSPVFPGSTACRDMTDRDPEMSIHLYESSGSGGFWSTSYRLPRLIAEQSNLPRFPILRRRCSPSLSIV